MKKYNSFWEFLGIVDSQPVVENDAPQIADNLQQDEFLFRVPIREDRLKMVDPKNPNCPLSKFVGNQKAIKRLARSAFAALGRENHLCNDQFFSLIGPSSAGKTTLVKLFAQTVSLPFIEIEPQSIGCVADIVEKIDATCRKYLNRDDDPLELVRVDGRIKLPPMIIFIDEVHNLSKNVVYGLLKATEASDHQLTTEDGLMVDTENVCWFIATTDRGLLFDAFDTRFTQVPLSLYTKKDIAKIVKLNNPDWSNDVCKLVAHYAGRIPREALSFARDMRLVQEMLDSHDWKEIASEVADDHDIDEYGMSLQRVRILTELAKGPVSANRLSHTASCKEEELKKFVMPALLAKTEDGPSLVTVSSRGYVITPEGLAELIKRNIPCTPEPILSNGSRNRMNRNGDHSDN